MRTNVVIDDELMEKHGIKRLQNQEGCHRVRSSTAGADRFTEEAEEAEGQD